MIEIQPLKKNLYPIDNGSCWCCGGNWYVVFQTTRFGLLCCSTCQTYRIDPRPVSAPEEIERFYTRYYRECETNRRSQSLQNQNPNMQVFISRFWKVVDQFPEINLVGRSVLDFGCGTGELCGELKRAGWAEVLGVDISRPRIARARLRHPEVVFHDMPMEQSDILADSLDLIIMDNVIEHLINPVDTLQGLLPYLKRSGRLVVITPNLASGHFLLLGRRWTPELAPHTHIFLFTPDSLKACLVKVGLEILTCGSFHLNPYSLKLWLNRLYEGDIKGALWRGIQELGGLYGRLIGSGPMLYAVARLGSHRR